ncbi:hypothetical protein BR93DRAFT_519682 [Coniochaeta sp. PMI_546]|nr:hypothetical protein BR93DRAFT_519682 [Coniochaeta sp. PMI_546]
MPIKIFGLRSHPAITRVGRRWLVGGSRGHPSRPFILRRGFCSSNVLRLWSPLTANGSFVPAPLYPASRVRRQTLLPAITSRELLFVSCHNARGVHPGFQSQRFLPGRIPPLGAVRLVGSVRPSHRSLGSTTPHLARYIKFQRLSAVVLQVHEPLSAVRYVL